MMRIAFLVALALTLLNGCGGNITGVSCDEGPYMAAERGKRVEAPTDLDNLNPVAEMPLPAASPQEPWPEEGPCLESPPTIIRMN